ncbi:MAG: hypothetical protein HQL31_11880 [Planctomycetes bacterium]|nr:hypothetical protein [Planctomycetota bacterium]
MKYEKELESALAAARDAGVIQMKMRGSIGEIARKGDDSPVTAVDRRCEEAIRRRLLGDFHEDAFLGEESGATQGSSGRRWIVDPLDGTRPYIRGIPTHSALVALEDGEGPAVGVIHLPALGETYWALRGGGAYLNGEKISVSGVASLDRAMGSFLGLIEEFGSPEADSLLRIMQALDYTYGFMDAYSYGSLACGRIDVAVNLLDKAWDCAAGALIVSEAGGRFSDIKGEPTVHSGNILLSNGLLHEDLLRFFA